jgi:FixJ family two-component response regulator
MSGIEMRRRLKAMGSTTPVIFMTRLRTLGAAGTAVTADSGTGNVCVGRDRN